MNYALLIWQLLLGLCTGLLSLYTIYQLHLSLKATGYRTKQYEEADDKVLPLVCIQLPLYNEGTTVLKTFSHLDRIDYPKELLEIQILDDSTENDSIRLNQRLTERLNSQGFNANYLRREQRTDFKAGALREGLQATEAPFIAILDADFRIPKDWLKKSIQPFTDPDVGVVQTRWDFENRNDSWFTQMQALPLDVHFRNEHCGRSTAQYFSNFNGTAGIWRRTAIEESGNWSGDTLTEDIDLSYRAQLKKYLLVYLDEISIPSELPTTASAYRIQQRRWNKGGAETFIKHGRSLLRAPINRDQQVMGILHLSGSSFYIATFGLYFLSACIPLLTVRPTASFWFVLGGVLTVNTLILYRVFLRAHFIEKPIRFLSLLRFTGLFCTYLIYTSGLSLRHTIAVLEGLSGRKTPFERTPKKGATRGTTKQILWIEAGLALLFLSILAWDITHRELLPLGIHLMATLSFSLSFMHSCKS